MPLPVSLMEVGAAVASAVFASAAFKGLSDTLRSVLKERRGMLNKSVVIRNSVNDAKVVTLDVENLKTMSHDIDDLKRIIDQLITDKNQDLTVKLTNENNQEELKSPPRSA